MTPSSRRRGHDAGASRRALLDAAAQLFDERGYERATIRQIGDRAGVDAALIARYFGGKEGLYVAALGDPARTMPALDSAPSAGSVARALLAAWERRQPTPLRRALVSADPPPEVRDRIAQVVQERLVGPLADELERRGVPAARLRAELVVAVVTGTTLLRVNGVLAALQRASVDQVLEVLEPMLQALETPR